MYDNCEKCAEIIEVPRNVPVLTVECPKCGHVQEPRVEYCTIDEDHARKYRSTQPTPA